MDSDHTLFIHTNQLETPTADEIRTKRVRNRGVCRIWTLTWNAFCVRYVVARFNLTCWHLANRFIVPKYRLQTFRSRLARQKNSKDIVNSHFESPLLHASSQCWCVYSWKSSLRGMCVLTHTHAHTHTEATLRSSQRYTLNTPNVRNPSTNIAQRQPVCTSHRPRKPEGELET